MLVALDALKGISGLHTDIQLDNIVLVNQKDRPFRVKLIDFGVALKASEVCTVMTVQPIGFR